MKKARNTRLCIQHIHYVTYLKLKFGVVIKFDVDRDGNPMGDVQGNIYCWLGGLEYATKDATEGKKLFCYYNKRKKEFGNQSIGVKPNQKGAKNKREVPYTQIINPYP